ncbi:hypothetical protein R1sor_025916 [Riccia sorocarpa]|uniref:Uncharacterized protein n=1 Tax=Riccia sorocarpa TaxID=122646 RepID=A0ABD3GAI4_9MARC
MQSESKERCEVDNVDIQHDLFIKESSADFRNTSVARFSAKRTEGALFLQRRKDFWQSAPSTEDRRDSQSPDTKKTRIIGVDSGMEQMAEQIAIQTAKRGILQQQETSSAGNERSSTPARAPTGLPPIPNFILQQPGLKRDANGSSSKEDSKSKKAEEKDQEGFTEVTGGRRKEKSSVPIPQKNPFAALETVEEEAEEEHLQTKETGQAEGETSNGGDTTTNDQMEVSLVEAKRKREESHSTLPAPTEVIDAAVAVGKQNTDNSGKQGGGKGKQPLGKSRSKQQKGGTSGAQKGP